VAFNHEPDSLTGISAAQQLLPALLLQGQVARLRKDAEIRALPVSAIVRETLDARFREQPHEGR
jgi:hypothetical protein